MKKLSKIIRWAENRTDAQLAAIFIVLILLSGVEL